MHGRKSQAPVHVWANAGIVLWFSKKMMLGQEARQAILACQGKPA
jgi:hypothetical protein